MENLYKAIQFAAKAHNGQKRKGTEIPYITHPFAVAMLLLREGCDEDVVIAGLLHDVVEDTSVTIEQVKAEFGDRVSDLVMQCTDLDNEMVWEDRKQQTILKLQQAPLEVKVIACADKLHNISCMIEDYALVGDSLWTRFRRGSEQQKWYYRELLTSLFTGLPPVKPDSIFYRFQEQVEKFMNIASE